MKELKERVHDYLRLKTGGTRIPEIRRELPSSFRLEEVEVALKELEAEGRALFVPGSGWVDSTPATDNWKRTNGIPDDWQSGNRPSCTNQPPDRPSMLYFPIADKWAAQDIWGYLHSLRKMVTGLEDPTEAFPGYSIPELLASLERYGVGFNGRVHSLLWNGLGRQFPVSTSGRKSTHQPSNRLARMNNYSIRLVDLRGRLTPGRVSAAIRGGFRHELPSRPAIQRTNPPLLRPSASFGLQGEDGRTRTVGLKSIARSKPQTEKQK